MPCHGSIIIKFYKVRAHGRRIGIGDSVELTCQLGRVASLQIHDPVCATHVCNFNLAKLPPGKGNSNMTILTDCEGDAAGLCQPLRETAAKDIARDHLAVSVHKKVRAKVIHQLIAKDNLGPEATGRWEKINNPSFFLFLTFPVGGRGRDTE
ncbi:hypothetical protein DM01DRAFT_198198 [Hesseltinella vesiculosa]|uniref:Uncharacterized protein n=1 Tax=Hesseltinella vesiculosa TaxID=101127 RepID=A0A1X2GKE2_9FUNG|nr:hypothetical protein DM01DRAFT_198198 [Hesseltinella vesiculosa]